MVMHLKTCCCGCTLKTGTVFVGIMSAIGSLIALVLYIIAASVLSGEAAKEFGYPQGDVVPPPQEDNSVGTGVLILLIVMAIVVALELIISIILIFGASAERANLVKPWIIFTIITTTVNGIGQIIRVIMFFVAGAVMVGFLSLLFTAIGITMAVYFILVVNSFHTELLANNFQNKV